MAYWEPWHSQHSLFRDFRAYSGTFSNIQPFSGIVRDIKAYWGIFEHYWGVWSRIDTYTELCVTHPCTTVLCMYNLHVQSVGHVRWSCIFRALAYSEELVQASLRIFIDIHGYWCIFNHTHRWRHVLVMSRTRFRVNPHYIVAWMSRNSLLKAGTKSEL